MAFKKHTSSRSQFDQGSIVAARNRLRRACELAFRELSVEDLNLHAYRIAQSIDFAKNDGRDRAADVREELRIAAGAESALRLVVSK